MNESTRYTDQCQACSRCKLKGARTKDQIQPLLRAYSKVLFVLDRPSVKDVDAGILLSGASPRQAFFGWLCKELQIDINNISFASAISCVIEHRGIVTTADYINCSENLKSFITDNSFEYVVFFGALPYTGITRTTVGNIDKERGIIREIPGTSAKGILTYALNLIVDGEGCSSCGRSVYRMLARKDIGIIVKEMAKYGTKL